MSVLVLDPNNPGLLSEANSVDSAFASRTEVDRLEAELTRRRNEFVLDAYDRGKALARRYSLFQWEEDMAQQAALAALEGKQNTKYAVIDWLRSFLGSNKRRARMSWFPIDEMYESELPQVFQEHSLDLDRVIASLKSEMDRKVVFLVFKEGLDNCEAARVLAVSESMVSLVLKRVLSKKWVQKLKQEGR